MTDNIPLRAIRVWYKASNGKSGFYFLWQSGPGSWYWRALGNTGEEPTQGAAREAACRWIRDGKR